MKFVVIDIETTGVDSEKNQIIEIGALIEDTEKKLPIEELPRFKAIIKHDSYVGSSVAINMNNRIFSLLSQAEIIRNSTEKSAFESKYNIITISQAIGEFRYFIKQYYFDGLNPEPINIAGKNFPVFDKLFLDKAEFWDKNFKYERRFIDPAMFYVDWSKDRRLPSLDECLKRAGIERQVTHDAIEDCIDTLLCLRAKY